MASVGMAMLNGQTLPKRALHVMLSAFILFDASMVANDLLGWCAAGAESRMQSGMVGKSHRLLADNGCQASIFLRQRLCLGPKS